MEPKHQCISGKDWIECLDKSVDRPLDDGEGKSSAEVNSKLPHLHTLIPSAKLRSRRKAL